MTFIIISIFVISILGTIAHFLYEISGHNKIIGLFTAVNESTWEHIKIALTPTLIWSLVDGFKYGYYSNYFFAKLISLIVIIVLIPILFYGYKVVIKKDIAVINIVIFYVAIVCSQLSFYCLLKMNSVAYIYRYLSCVGLFIVFGAYLLLTLLPLENFIFKDPISKKYGFNGHKH